MTRVIMLISSSIIHLPFPSHSLFFDLDHNFLLFCEFGWDFSLSWFTFYCAFLSLLNPKYPARIGNVNHRQGRLRPCAISQNSPPKTKNINIYRIIKISNQIGGPRKSGALCGRTYDNCQDPPLIIG